jgi:hypothetical protein
MYNLRKLSGLAGMWMCFGLQWLLLGYIGICALERGTLAPTADLALANAQVLYWAFIVVSTILTMMGAWLTWVTRRK